MEYSDKVIKAFYNDCTELVDNLEEQLLLLEKTPGNKDTINEIFRLAHSIKSEAALMGFNKFSSLAHKMEDVLQMIREESIALNSSLLDLFLKISDRFKQILEILSKTCKEEIEVKDLIEQLEKIDSLKEQGKQKEKISEVKILEISQQDVDSVKKGGFKNVFQINVKLFDNVALKYARAFLIYNKLASAGKILRSSVDFTKQQEDNVYVNFSLLLATNKTENEIYNIADVSEVERISIKIIYRLETEKDVAVRERFRLKTVRVDLNKVEQLMSSLGELIVNYNRLEKVVQYIISNQFSKEELTELEDITIQFKRVIDLLQDNIMKIRMVPLKTLFDKLPHLIRELSQQLNKEVILSISGEYTEIDRTVIDEIREPLIHIIRNAIDHGIEPPEERKQKGKSDKGKITIKSYQSGNNIVIEIQDDGRGMDIEKIKRRAVEMGLTNNDRIARMSENDIIEFIFTPGFSTSTDITDISGRGVGMDVVKNNIEKLQGKIKVYTKKDIGTTILISLPLTLAIVESLVIESAGLNFAIPLYFIEETLRIYKNEIKIVDEYEVIDLRGKLLALLKLNEILELQATKSSEKKKNKYFVVVVSYENKRVGIVVDRLVSQQDIVIKPISELISKFEAISGVTILGDGSIAYILDPSKVVGYYIKR